ncbi:hypothetical protein [Enterococcus sp. DIV0187]|uniref:hypothetical protein n=1 Tax=Enterococcus sp. DIV0187 TaxID=2774644 RepID=UPI003F220B6A
MRHEKIARLTKELLDVAERATKEDRATLVAKIYQDVALQQKEVIRSLLINLAEYINSMDGECNENT